MSAFPPRRSRMTKLLRFALVYGGAAAAALGAIGLRSVLDPWLGAEAPYILVFGASAVAVWLGGAGPAVLTAALGYALVNVLYIEPIGRFGIAHAGDVINLGLFVLACTLIIALGEGMRRARDRARRSDAQKSEFLALLSHELRNPLAALQAGVEILKLKPGGAPASSIAGMMERQTVHLTRLLDDLLDVSRIEHGNLLLRTERLALDAVVRSAVEAAMPAIDARSHELVVQPADASLHVHGDGVRLSQVLSNLLHNAAKFTPAPGRIELTVRADGAYAVITVADSGIGLASEHLESVFEMFSQVRAGAVDGLGIGLTLARSLVERHGGELRAKSRGVGEGAQFIVRLPLAPLPTGEAQHTPVPPAASVPRNVLIVDDNADAAFALGELLRLQGHHVDVATDGETGLRAARGRVPDVALIDLNMPGMDGIELARRLRVEPGGARIRLVALTGMGQQADLARTRAAGFHAHLTKPADANALARLLAERGEVAVTPARGAG